MSGNLTMGIEVKKFEAKMASYLGAKHFVMVNSGSSANLLMIEALMRPTISTPRLKPGDGVLVPAIAWPTTIWPLIQLGLRPVFVDVDPNNLAIDLKKAQEVINSTKILVRGIFPIHPLGHAIPPSSLEEFVRENRLVLINDVCESLGSWSEGLHAGLTGVAASFSFYFSHHITTMEGGGIATNDFEFADDLRSMRSHGWSRDRSDAKKWTDSVSVNDSKFLFVSTGYNVRPMEIQAAIGGSQIKSIDVFVEKRRHIAKLLDDKIHGSNLSIIGRDSLHSNEYKRTNSWMMIPIRVHGLDAATEKAKIVNSLNKFGIETRPVLTGNFLAQPSIQRISQNPSNPQNYEEADNIARSSFLVGAHHDLSSKQIRYLCEIFEKISDR